jgi:hypothetical protein
VKRVTTDGTPDLVSPGERIAVFDNDGTLWPEQRQPRCNSHVCFFLPFQRAGDWLGSYSELVISTEP